MQKFPFSIPRLRKISASHGLPRLGQFQVYLPVEIVWGGSASYTITDQELFDVLAGQGLAGGWPPVKSLLWETHETSSLPGGSWKFCYTKTLSKD